MSYVKREFENLMYKLGPIDAFDWLLDNGWDENEARETVDLYFGEY